jgi:hypothetical protein
MSIDNGVEIRDVFKSEFSRQKVEKMDSSKYLNYLDIASGIGEGKLMS